ncbi:EF-hand domain-containing protein [Salidesulfovibrio brasiliensis]|uniref:EF-hand domain-containing protein n=1 Tax=Salidesulfovibrio brasiliensis TaxID=221711 RepID=UPI0006CF7070|nr:EF-hand domain-containing protein [Salidesulfovibrio brasiliensis]
MEIGGSGAMYVAERPGQMRHGGRERPNASTMASSALSELDTNEDGVLSNEELGIDSDKFSKQDTDGDGVLNRSELEAGAQAHIEKMRQRFEMGQEMESAEMADRSMAMQAYENAGSASSLYASGAAAGANNQMVSQALNLVA